MFVLPSVFILLGLSYIYVTFGNLPWVYALFEGLKPAVVAIVVPALLKIGRKSLKTPFHYVIAALSFVGIFFLNIPFPLLIVGALVLALVLQAAFPRHFAVGAPKDRAEPDEQSYYLNSTTIAPGTGFKPGRLLRQVLAAAGLWALPLVLFYFSRRTLLSGAPCPSSSPRRPLSCLGAPTPCCPMWLR